LVCLVRFEAKRKQENLVVGRSRVETFRRVRRMPRTLIVCDVRSGVFRVQLPLCRIRSSSNCVKWLAWMEGSNVMSDLRVICRQFDPRSSIRTYTSCCLPACICILFVLLGDTCMCIHVVCLSLDAHHQHLSPHQTCRCYQKVASIDAARCFSQASTHSSPVEAAREQCAKMHAVVSTQSSSPW
jgi:hypothetical protein